jgi:CDP-glucose 4,6-dehydratase
VTWQGRTVLVTGATGLVGSWLTSRLVDGGARVVALVAETPPDSEFARARLAERVTVVPGLLEDPRSVDRAVIALGVDTVFHLGAQAIVGIARRDPLGTFEANIRGTYLLLDACRRSGGAVQRVVVASSDKSYGEAAELPYLETMPLQGRQPYEVSKSCTDLLAQCYATTYGLPVALARCGNIYGGGDLNWSRIVPGTIRSLLRGEVPLIRSDGSLVRDYLHVDDVVDAYLSLADWLDREPGAAADPAGIAFNFSDEDPRTVLEIYEAVCDAFGTKVEPRILGEASDEIPAQYLDATRARQVLGWKGGVGLADGLERTLGWYRSLLVGS